VRYRVVDQLLVAEVEQHPDVAARRLVGHGRQTLFGDQGAGGVAWRIDDDAACAGCDGREQRVGAERETVLGMRADDDRRGLGELDLLDERRPARHVRDHFVARAEQHHDGVEERLLAAGRDDDLARRVLDAVVLTIAAAIARFRSSVPELVVYFVKCASMAALAASEMCAGVGKSGSPAPKSITSTPCALSLIASAATFIVGDTPMRPCARGQHAARGH
jgi:hypothetical protein